MSYSYIAPHHMVNAFCALTIKYFELTLTHIVDVCHIASWCLVAFHMCPVDVCVLHHRYRFPLTHDTLDVERWRPLNTIRVNLVRSLRLETHQVPFVAGVGHWMEEK